MQYRVLITGTSRGIGLEMVKQAVRKQWRVFACVRDPHTPQKLFEVARMSGGLVSVHLLDVADPAQIQALAYELKHEPLDILINNAGTYGPDEQEFGTLDVQSWLDTFSINTIAPLKIAETLHANLSRGQRKLIVNLTSKMGSIDDNHSGGCYAYRSSKCALNMIMKSMAIDLAPQGFTCVNLHPGWVKTEMGGPHAEITTAQSVKAMFDILDNVTHADNGKYYDIDGSLIPW
ncbi:MAG: SDR family oxidoreductase [Gammaproteobacteria bacterium]|nr:SDR family oxidoreductase [Gammaproteobacteria bacterium]